VVVLAGLGAGGATVLARSTATYTNHMIAATDFASNGDHAAPADADCYWLRTGYGQSSTWTFGDVDALGGALKGSLWLNIAAPSTALNWGAGYNTDLKVVVTGKTTGTFTTTLVNPWRPHVAFNEVPGVGWEAHASLLVPNSIWIGASSLTVKVTPLTAGNHVGTDIGMLMLGYATTP
jgi:hypothetical protein